MCCVQSRKKKKTGQLRRDRLQKKVCYFNRRCFIKTVFFYYYYNAINGSVNFGAWLKYYHTQNDRKGKDR